MIALSFNQIKKSYFEQNILESASFSINAGEKMGLIGKNGVGKTTLLKLITKQEVPDDGVMYIDTHTTIGYMQQNDINQSISLIDFCTEAFDHLIKIEAQLTAMELKMADFSKHDQSFNAFMEKYEALTRKFEHLEGYQYKSKVRGILTGLGFSESEQSRSIKTLSGGQVAKLKLARLLAESPDILLLDEPTNHLDIKTTTWLENYLKQYTKTVIIVSHDRYFLDAICTCILEIENSKTYFYTGNYSAFKIKKEALVKQMTKVYERYETERKKQKALIQKFKQHGTEKLAKRAKSREKRLESLITPEKYKPDKKQMKLNLKKHTDSGTEVLQIQNISKSFGDNEILKNVNFNLYRDEKVGLIGDNGTGKSTLLKIILGDLEADYGDIVFGHHVLPAYYSQNHEERLNATTIFEEIHNMVPQMDESDIRTLLGRFLFSGEDVFKPIDILSGGEKARVMLTKLFLIDANLLLLDEPTNHLDLYSKESLESSLKDYDGTMVIISHDRYFLNTICDRIVEIENGILTNYLGNYNYYSEKKNALSLSTVKSTDEISKTEKKQLKKRTRQQINEKKALRLQIEALEARIHTSEERLKEITHALCLKEIYSDTTKLTTLLKEQKNIKMDLADCYEIWMKKTEALIE